MSTEIIVVKQLPVIVEQLAQVKEQVIQRVELTTSLVCTDDTVKEVKKARAELNNEFKSWEEKRKEVKNAVMTPYEKFEAVYKDCISDTYKKADAELKDKINAVENELKEKKLLETKEYFEEYAQSTGIDFVKFEQAGINITLGASKKSLKEQAKNYIDKIVDDLKLIDTQEYKTEILVEYKRTLNASAAIMSVTERMKAIEAEKQRQEEAARRKAEEEKRIAEIEAIAPVPEPVQELSAPVEVTKPEYLTPEQEFTLRFEVTATKQKLKELKTFLDQGGYKYNG